jgi:enoyl-CoA hydratase
MTAPVLLTSRDGAVRTLTLNRPWVRNALDGTLVAALGRAVADAEADPATKVLVLAGAGKSFCAGADLNHLQAVPDPLPFLTEVSELVTRLERSSLPVVAALHGHAVAGGLELALGCDVVIAAADTLIGDGHLRNDLLPGAGSSVRMPRKLGEPLARWLLLTGNLVPAQELRLRTGWLHALVEPAELRPTALAVAHALADQAGPTQTRAKHLLADLAELSPATGLRHELATFDRHWNTHDVSAAVRSFLDARNGSRS